MLTIGDGVRLLFGLLLGIVLLIVFSWIGCGLLGLGLSIAN